MTSLMQLSHVHAVVIGYKKQRDLILFTLGSARARQKQFRPRRCRRILIAL
jgi:hypothetical protein